MKTGYLAFVGLFFPGIVRWIGFAIFLAILYWRRQEERELESNYGEVYLGYRKRTWF